MEGVCFSWGVEASASNLTLFETCLYLISRFILIACDGLFKVFTPEEAVNFIVSCLEVREGSLGAGLLTQSFVSAGGMK